MDYEKFENICKILGVTDAKTEISVMPSSTTTSGYQTGVQMNAVNKTANKNKKKENVMYRNPNQPKSLADAEQDKVEHLLGRLFSIRDKKETELREKFNMDNRVYPKTWGELRAWIKDGNRLAIHKDYDTQKDDVKLDRWGNSIGYLTFIDPSKSSDPEGYEAAAKKLYEASMQAEDIIIVHDPIAGLEALKTFESQTF